ncbi:SAV_2336 N-terminal domain-related protein [Streptomyces sp. NPDC090445]|uniref:SAV_2336 N-terminal domain-related protein n=1 Tax=Streptomyces sp. NPDC090445 TaxID=3365963 RepID=UPI0037F56F0A
MTTPTPSTQSTPPTPSTPSAPFNGTPWIVTTMPQESRPVGGTRAHVPVYPPKPVFSPPPASWPKVIPVPGTRAAARALHALGVLDRDRSQPGALHVPNAPGTHRTSPHHPSAWDLVLVIDTGASMTAWYPTIDSFVACTHEVPLFTDVQVVKLHSQGFDPDRSIFDKVALENAGLNSGRRKIVFLITDGVGPAWKRSEVWEQTREWASIHPLAILHVQPHQNWARSAVHTHTLPLRSSEVGGANSTLEQKPAGQEPLNGLLTPVPVNPGDVIVPVLELRKRWLDQWCRLLLSRQWVRQQALVVGRDGPPEIPATAVPDRAPGADAEKRVIEFLASASAETTKLAGFLASAPLNRHVMQLIGGQLLPMAGPGDLSEILSSGLIRVTEPTNPDDAPYDRVTFDFEPGVREALLAREGWEKSQAVAKLIEEYLSPVVGAVKGLAQRIEFRTPPDALVVTYDNLPFVMVERTVLQAMPLVADSEALRRMGMKIDALAPSPSPDESPATV